MSHRIWLPVAALLISLSVSNSASGTDLNVSINTSAISGAGGQLAFDFSVNTPPSGHVEILNFIAPGSSAGLPGTQGGLVMGDLILPPFNSGASTEIEGGSFFNELIVNFVNFGNTISFALSAPDIAPASVAIPNEFALFLLDVAGTPLFPTSDPSGANALFALDITGLPGGTLSVFSPTVFASPNQLTITVPGESSAVPEPATLVLIASGFASMAAYKRFCRAQQRAA